MSEINTNPDSFNDDEITLKEIILKIKDYFTEVVKHWKIVLLVTFLFLSYLAYKSIKSEYSYKAKLTFMINQTEGSSLSGLGGILGQFGFGEKSEFNKNKIMILNKSRRIVEKAIFEKVKINGKEDFLANHIIINQDTLGRWASVPLYMKPFAKENPLKGFLFKNGNFEKFNDLENSALKSVFNLIAGDPDTGGAGVMTNGFDKESGIMHISTNTTNPELSIAITNKVFDNLSRFYIEKTIEKQKATYDVLKAKTDSIFALLQGKEAGAAAIEDRNIASWGSTTKLPSRRHTRDIQKLTIMYSETLKNLEISDFAVRNQMPFVQPIDRPIMPISGVKTSIVKSMMIGLFLGIFISTLFIIFRKIIREALDN
ncbi:MAG: hypothetical protein IPH57_18325 [Saprospiraceae bacterium]|nr:hypothetical protein [Saprospiraceae bacterium]